MGRDRAGLLSMRYYFKQYFSVSGAVRVTGLVNRRDHIKQYFSVRVVGLAGRRARLVSRRDDVKR